jgi:hypothetical protein
LTAKAESVCLVEMQRENEVASALYLNVGLTNGVLQVR